MDEIAINASCHCGFACYTCKVPSTAFPLKAATCSCASCRRASGLLFVAYAVIPTEPPDFSDLTRYDSSTALARLSCPKCGACVGNTWSEGFELSTGMLQKTEGLLRRTHLWIDDCKDGGAGLWLGELAGEEMETHVRGRETEQVSLETIKDIVARSRENIPVEDSLPARCHCGDVQFSISRSTDSIPNGRYEAFLDSCTSCRTVSGFEVTSWARIPQKHITMKDGAPLDLSIAAIGHYNSSPGKNRYFCKRCGALVFYQKDGDDSIDIGVGLLDAQSGSRAEGWLAWKKSDPSVEYTEDATDPLFVDSLAKGIEADSGL